MEEPREPSRGLNQEERLEMLIENFSKDDSFPTEVFDDDLLIPSQLEELARKVCEPLSAARPFDTDDVLFADTTNKMALARDLPEIDDCTLSEDKEDKSHSQEVTFEEHSKPADEVLIEEVIKTLEIKEESSAKDVVDPSLDVSLAAQLTNEVMPSLGAEPSGIAEKTDESCLDSQDDVSNKAEETLRDTNEETISGDKLNLTEKLTADSNVHSPLQVCDDKVEDLERSDQSVENEEVNVSIQQEIFIQNDAVIREQEGLQQKEPTQEITQVLLSGEPVSSVTGSAQSKEDILPTGAANSINEADVDDKTCNSSVPETCIDSPETNERTETKDAQKNVRVESNVPPTQESAQDQYEALHEGKPDEAVTLAATESSDVSQQSQKTVSKVESEQEVNEVCEAFDSFAETTTSTKELSEISPQVSAKQQVEVVQKLDEVACETFEYSSVGAITLANETSDVAQQVNAHPQVLVIQEVNEVLCEAFDPSAEATTSPRVGVEQEVEVVQKLDEDACETFESSSFEVITLSNETSDVAQQVNAHPQVLVVEEVNSNSSSQEVNEDVCQVVKSSSAEVTTSTKELSKVSPQVSAVQPKPEVETVLELNEATPETFESSSIESTDLNIELSQVSTEPQVEIVQEANGELPESKVQDEEPSTDVTYVETVDIQMERKAEVSTETQPEELPTTSSSFNEATSSNRKKKKNQRVQQPAREPHKDSSVGSQGNKENLPLPADSNQTGGRSKKNKSKNKNAKAVASPIAKEKLSSQATASPSIGSAASDEEDNEKVP